MFCLIFNRIGSLLFIKSFLPFPFAMIYSSNHLRYFLDCNVLLNVQSHCQVPCYIMFYARAEVLFYSFVMYWSLSVNITHLSAVKRLLPEYSLPKWGCVTCAHVSFILSNTLLNVWKTLQYICIVRIVYVFGSSKYFPWVSIKFRKS